MAELVSADWLRTNYEDARVLDCHFNMDDIPAGHAEYAKAHLPNAAHFAIEKSAKATDTVKRAFFTEQEFTDYARSLGVNEGDHVVLYDHTPHGLGPATRAWFLFHIFGQKKLSVLRGGFKAWQDCGGPVTDHAYSPKPGNFTAKFNPSSNLNLTYDEFVAAVKAGTPPILDARPPNNYGEKHVKGAKSLPAGAFFKDGTLVTKDEILKIANTKAGVTPNDHPVTYCNSAMGSSMLMFILNYGGIPARNFNGAIFEVTKRDPSLLEA